jgi:hopanoid biosynthesis associated protein HpnK
VTRLIVNADDFGMTPGVNRSIPELHRATALSSATLMATAGHTAEAVSLAAENPTLGVGCHIVLVDGQPALPSAQIPALAPPAGLFRPTLGTFVRDLVQDKIPESEIEAEATAQIRRLQAAGVSVTHLDTHKHTHMFPRVLRPLLRAAAQCGVKAIRNPFEPDWALKATPHAPALRKMQVRLLRTQRKAFLKLVQKSGLKTTDGAIGVLATGTLDQQTIRSLLKAMPNGTWELVCHPGYVDEALGQAKTRLRESRAIEHGALLSTLPQFLREHSEVALIHFRHLQERTGEDPA